MDFNPTNHLPDDFSYKTVNDLEIGEAGWMSPAGAINTGKDGVYIDKAWMVSKDPVFPNFLLVIRTSDGLLADISAAQKMKFVWPIKKLSELDLNAVEKVFEITMSSPIKLWAKTSKTGAAGSLKITPKNISPVDHLLEQIGIQVRDESCKSL